MVIACDDPRLGSGLFPCGKCARCLSLRRRTWAHRIMIEAEHHEENSFITLTYAPDTEPADGSLRIGDVQGWLKRMRSAVSPKRLRTFYVGEYGDQTQRPHYHAALFGYRSCTGRGSFNAKLKGDPCPCESCSLVRHTWKLGHVLVGSLSPKSAMYLAGYVTKKMTHRHHPDLHGREPEFSRMSLKPGIGAAVAPRVAFQVSRLGRTIPPALRREGRLLPIGRYLRTRVAKEICGQDAPKEVLQAWKGSQEAVDKQAKALFLLRSYAQAVDKLPIEILKEIKVIPVIPTIHSPTTKRRL